MSQQKSGIKLIAEIAKVSIGTVDRVLHNRPGVSLKTKKKIDKIIKELNYEPNVLARRLASKKILKFASLIPSVSKETSYWQAPLEGITQAENEIKAFGITVDKFFFDLNDKRTFATQSRKILSEKYDGVLLSPNFEKDAVSFITQLDKKNIPFVFINSDIPDQNNLCYIGPHLFQSGFLGGQLADMINKNGNNFLIVNISREIDNRYYLLRKEDGFRDYFKNNKKVTISNLNLTATNYSSIKQKLKPILKNQATHLIFVTNSRVFYIAKMLSEEKLKNIRLIGFDFIDKNIEYLENGTIDYLISQKPREQAYRGIMALYKKVLNNESMEKQQYMPIDIITKENYKFYTN